MTEHLHQHGPDCLHDDDVPIAWRAAALASRAARWDGNPLTFTDHGELDEHPRPPSQPPGWVDPEWLQVEPEPVDPRIPSHRPYRGWGLDPTPTPHWFAWFGLGVCVGILVLALVITASKAVDAAPSETHEPAASQAVLGSRGAPSSFPGSDPAGGASQPTGGIGTALIGGWASWYEDPGHPRGFYAAAGPELRAALGPGWRHRVVEVTGPARASVLVELVDSCACGNRHGMPTFLDLSADAFAELAPLEAGIVAVSIEIPPALPRTDADLRMMLEVRGDELYRADQP